MTRIFFLFTLVIFQISAFLPSAQAEQRIAFPNGSAAIVRKNKAIQRILYETPDGIRVELYHGERLKKIHASHPAQPWVWFEMTDAPDDESSETTHDRDDSKNRYYLLEDGTWMASILNDWTDTQVSLLEVGEDRFFLENLRKPENQPNHRPRALTVISKLIAPENREENPSSHLTQTMILDNQQHEFHASSMQVQDDHLVIADVRPHVEFTHWCKSWSIHLTPGSSPTTPLFLDYPTQSQWLDTPPPIAESFSPLLHPSPSPDFLLSPLTTSPAVQGDFKLTSCNQQDESPRPGVTLTRNSDHQALRLSSEGLDGLEKSLRSGTHPSAAWTDFWTTDDLLELPELHRTVDLLRFDEELIQNAYRQQRNAPRTHKRARIQNTKPDFASDSSSCGDDCDPESSGPTARPDQIVRQVSQYTDLVEEARAFPERYLELLDPTIGQQINFALSQGQSAVLLGQSGTGKTSAVRAFAKEVALGHIPGLPRSFEIRHIPIFTLASGTTKIGMLEERIETLIQYSKERSVIYFIDDIQGLRGQGAHSTSPTDMTQWIQNALDTGALRLIGTSSHELFHQNFDHNPGFIQKFKEIKIEQPQGQSLIQILESKLRAMKRTLTPDLLAQVIERSSLRGATTTQPQAAVALLTECGDGGPCNTAIEASALDRASAQLYGRSLVGHPKEELRQNLLQLQKDLDLQFIGQPAAKKTIRSLWVRQLSGVGHPNQANSILFVGPPGVGKTSIAQRSAELMGYPMTRIEMNQYTQRDGVEQFRLKLYQTLVKHPRSVLILDEFEKAGSEVQDAALAILESGEFTLQQKTSQGGSLSKDVNAKNALFFLTSNAAGSWIREQSKNKMDIPDATLRARIIADGQITEQILDRIRDVVPMTNPTQEEFARGLERGIADLLERESNKHAVQITLHHKDQFIKECLKRFTAESDYRDLRRLVQVVENKLGEALLEQTDPTSIQIHWVPTDLPQIPQGQVHSYFI